MKTPDVIAALAALAQENRLAIFRLLVRRGPQGLAAGDIATRLDIAPATLSFHLTQLSSAGLVESERSGRSIIYSANYGRMNALLGFLNENCCVEQDGECCPPTSKEKKEKSR